MAAVTLLSQDSATAVTVSAYAVTDYERTSYYNGTTDEGEHPNLLYRTGSAKYLWIQSKGRHPYQPTKSLRGVYRTPLNDVWSTVGPQVRELTKDLLLVHSSHSLHHPWRGREGDSWSCRYLGWGLSRLYLRQHCPRSIPELL